MTCDSNPHGMSSDPVPSSESGADTAEVMASIETGEEQRLIIADITVEGSWIAMPTAAAASLPEWR